MNKHQISELIQKTETFKTFEQFKQKLTLSHKNLEDLADLYSQAERHSIDYLKQNPRLQASTIRLIDELLKLK